MFGNPVRFQEIGRDHRRDHARDSQRQQHRGNDGQAEALEELTRNAGQERDWRKDNHNGCRRCDHGQTDGVGAFHRRAIGPCTGLNALFDILDLNNGVIDD